MTGFNPTCFGQQDWFIQIETSHFIHSITRQYIHWSMTDIPLSSEIEISVHLCNLVTRQGIDPSIHLSFFYFVIAAQTLHHNVLREALLEFFQHLFRPTFPTFCNDGIHLIP